MPATHSSSQPRRVLLSITIGLAALAFAVLTTGCGDGAQAVPATAETSTASPPSPSPAVSSSTGVAAAASAGPVDTAYFTTVLPVGWEILADDIDRMGLMTLAEKGTGGAQGVYFKFEKGYSGDPKAAIEKMAARYGGSPVQVSPRNGVEWARTGYTYNGIRQSLRIAAHGGHKVSVTVMGKDDDEDPGVKAILDALELK